MKVSNEVLYVGVNDYQIDLFEGQYHVPNGISYNSYVIMDDKIAVMDSVDGNFTDEWLNNLKDVLGDKKPTYLVIHHMEPDHSGSIKGFVEKYPETILVGSAQALNLLNQFFPGIEVEKMMVKENDELQLGNHKLTFISAPMVHWPEVLFSYESKEKILFSADAFGKFGALDVQEDWVDEARRYYIGIVGKYGMQTIAALNKVSKFEIEKICSLHGPILDSDLNKYISLYQTWASYESEIDGVLIAYGSIYGHTKQAMEYAYQKLSEAGIKCEIFDLARSDMYEVVAKAFAYNKILMGCNTYNMDVVPQMKEFINHLVERNFQKKTIGLMENGSWAPNAKKVMLQMLSDAKDLNILEESVTIKSALNDDSKAQLEKLIEALKN